MSATWRPKRAVGISPEQCADPRERHRLWLEYVIEWVSSSPPATEGPTIPAKAVDEWMSQHGYDELRASFKCAAVKRDGRRCTNKRRAGSKFCGLHQETGR
jgi:hypothetical protein